MASTDIAYPAYAAQDADKVSPWFAGAIVLGTITFNAVLCFLNTRGLPATPSIVMVSEGLLLAAAGLAVLRYLNGTHLAIIALIVLNTVVLSMIRYVDVPSNGFDPKTTRDLIIPVLFFLLGQAMNNIKAADKIVLFSAVLLLVFAIFEQFALKAFLNVFQIADYYVARGTLEASNNALRHSDGLMISGTRAGDQERSFLPFLGTHRAGSLFLEPSTLGNFGAVVFLWATIRTRMTGKLFLLSGLCGLTLIVFSDTRLAGLVAGVGFIVALLPVSLTTPAMLAAPIVGVAGLWFFAAWTGAPNGVPEVEGLGLYDRLLYSGQVLHSFDLFNWLGLSLPRAQTFDAGYAYIISRASVLGFIALWGLFMSLRGRTSYFSAFRNAIAIYFLAQLCISASPFTIKLAGTLWFLLGVLSLAAAGSEKDPARATAKRRHVRQGGPAWTFVPLEGAPRRSPLPPPSNF